MTRICLLIIISFVVRSSIAIICLDCRRIPQPYDCTTVTECSINEVCYIEKYETSNGQTTWHLYNVGCKPLNSCTSSGPRLPVVGKRSARKSIDTTTCHECCSDKDICNLEGHCGSANFTKPFGSTLCYDCPLSKSSNTCNQLTLCDSDSACSIKQTQNLLGEPRWMHGCSQKSQCSTIAHINPQGICSFCCDTELCNRKCTIKSTVATPPSTSTTATTTMAPTTPIPHAKIRCLEGVRLTSPLDTTIVTECKDNEICSVERYVTNDGIILYNVGCKDRQYCIANPLGLGKRDETVICRQCCDDKDLCNMNQCGARVTLPVGSTLCYSCPLAMDSNKCNHIALCDRDSACSIKQTQNLIGQPRWSHGCSEKTQCATIAQSNPQGICSFCCDTELCNRNCNIKSTMAPITPIPLAAPIITQTVILPKNIRYGDTVTIQCLATGNPKPTIDFLIWGRRLGANVHVDPTTYLLTISNFLPYDDGVYRCIAANLLGDIHKEFHLQGHT